MESSVRSRLGARTNRSGVGRARGSRLLVGAALGAVLVVAAACSSSGASPPPTTKVAPGVTSSKAAAVSVSTVRHGSMGTILVDQAGRTLYRYSPDGTGKTTCTGACATVWPPLTVPAGTAHVAGKAGVSAADLGTITRPGGALQVTFKGMPLYRFSGDSKPGDVNGQGVDGTWFVVSPSASPAPSFPSPQSDVHTPAATATPMTSPPATSPPVTSPPATSPPATSPPATSPPATSPPVTSPPVTSPPVTQPPVTTPVTAPSGGYGY